MFLGVVGNEDNVVHPNFLQQDLAVNGSLYIYIKLLCFDRDSPFPARLSSLKDSLQDNAMGCIAENVHDLLTPNF